MIEKIEQELSRYDLEQQSAERTLANIAAIVADETEGADV